MKMFEKELPSSVRGTAIGSLPRRRADTLGLGQEEHTELGLEPHLEVWGKPQ